MRYAFGEYLFDTACYELYHIGTLVPLRPKVLEVLAYLVLHRDRIVSKQELLAQLWPDHVVGEEGLNAYIMAVRQALGDRGSAPQLLRTVRGRGYRFVAPVTVGEPTGSTQQPPTPRLAVTPALVDSPGLMAPTLVVTDPASPGTVLPVVDEEYKLVSVLCCALTDALALAARLDRLRPAEKGLLQTAAVIGHEFPVALLQAVGELPAEAVQQGLHRFQTAELLSETRAFPEQVYTFKHALTHEVAYGSLLQERRRVLHARLVEALEALAPDGVAEQIERLAHHALRGEVWDKAVAYCQQAGARAHDRAALREALTSFEQALQALAHLPEDSDTMVRAFEIRLALRSVLYPLGDYGQMLMYLHEAESLAAALDDPRRLAQVALFLSRYYTNTGAYEQAIAAAQRVLSVTTAGGEVVLHALAKQRLAFVYYAQGAYRLAIDCLRQTMVAFEGAPRHERFGDVFSTAVSSRVWLAWCHAELGTFAEGSACAEEGLQIAETVNHPGNLMLACRGIGLLALRQGDLPRALPRLEQAMGICQEADFPFFFPWMAAALGAAYTLGGRVADAVPLLIQGMEQITATEMKGLQWLCSLPLAEAHLLAGQMEEAHALAEGALALARVHQERGHQAYALRLLGDIAARREPLERELAEANYCQALALAEELGMRPLMAHCHLGLGMLYRQMVRLAEARVVLSTAIELYRAMDMTFSLPQAEVALAQVEG